MTVIVYRDGVMAADTGVNFQGHVKLRDAKKLFACNLGLFGISGDYAEATNFLNAVRSGAKESKWPKPRREDNNSSFNVLWVTKNSIRMLSSEGWEDHSEMPYIAMGSGAEIAFGALYAGASAETAVAAAIEFSQYCHGEVVSVSFAT